MDKYLAWTIHITDLQQENTQLSLLSSQRQCMSQDVISVVPHTSSTIFRRAACTLQTRADLPMSIRSNIATPGEVHTVDPTIPVELHLMLEGFVSLVTVVIFTALTLCYTATFILRPLCQYALLAILVRVKHWYSFKKISLPFSGLYSHTFRKLFEPLNLSFSNLLFLYTHTQSPQEPCFKPQVAKNPPQPQVCGIQEGYTKTRSTTTWDVSGEWAPVPRSAERGAFVLTAKWLEVQAKFLRGPPGKENSSRNLSPCPFSRHLRSYSSSQGYPTGKGRCSKGAPSPSTSATFS